MKEREYAYVLAQVIYQLELAGVVEACSPPSVSVASPQCELCKETTSTCNS